MHFNLGSHLGGVIVVVKNTWTGMGTTDIHNILIDQSSVISTGSVVIERVD